MNINLDSEHTHIAEFDLDGSSVVTVRDTVDHKGVRAVTVNWSAIGSVDTEKTMAFIGVLCEATNYALMREKMKR